MGLLANILSRGDLGVHESAKVEVPILSRDEFLEVGL